MTRIKADTLPVPLAHLGTVSSAAEDRPERANIPGAHCYLIYSSQRMMAGR